MNWTEEEDNVLREWYPKEGVKAFRRVERTDKACENRVRRLGIAGGAVEEKVWGEKEDKMILEKGALGAWKEFGREGRLVDWKKREIKLRDDE